MAKSEKGLEISIMGRDFRIACSEGEQAALLESVAHVDKIMREILDSGKVIGLERVAIMAALNLAHECIHNPKANSFDVAEFKRRINAMQERIDQAMCDQNQLF